MPETIKLGHGSGGRLSHDLIDQEIVSRFGTHGPLQSLPDASLLPKTDGDLLFSTDSFVVSPLEFPGGNIGDLAVHGTVNDIAVSGGIPRYLSLALIIEEGLPLNLLQRVLDSVQTAASDCQVRIVTGDTKVVHKGQCDQLYINTAGIGSQLPGFHLSKESIAIGDHVLVSGPLGQHGIAIMATREGLEIGGDLISDSAPVHRLVMALAPWAFNVRFMRDPTRGGLAAVLNECVQGTSIGIALDEQQLPFTPECRSVSEMLGIDLLHVASEGRMVAICDPHDSERILQKWQAMPEGEQACKIGEVIDQPGRVVITTTVGSKRLVDLPLGEILPRIC